LTKLKALNRDVHLVVFVGRDGEALSPDMETTLAHLKKLTKDTRVHLYDKFVDVDNPLEADLLRYISMTRKHAFNCKSTSRLCFKKLIN